MPKNMEGECIWPAAIHSGLGWGMAEKHAWTWIEFPITKQIEIDFAQTYHFCAKPIR